MDKPAYGRYARLFLVAAVLAEIVAIVVVTRYPYYEYVDTQTYRLGALTLLDGGDIYGPLPPTTTGNRLPFIYPPFAALLFVPLAVLPLTLALIAFTVVSHLAVLATAYLVVRSWTTLPAGYLVAAVCGMAALTTLSEPGRQTIAYGQINMVLMAMVAADCLLPRTRWPRGLLVGIAAGIKLTPLAFLAFFLLRKDFRALLTTAVVFVGTVLAGWLATPADSATWWFDRMGATAENFSPAFAGNLTIRGLLAKLEVPDPLLTVLWLVIAGGLAMLMLAMMRHALRQGNVPLAVLANAVWALLASPISWSHHWVVVIPAVVVLAAVAAWRRRRVPLALAIGAAVLSAIGPQWRVMRANTAAVDWSPAEQLIGNAYTVLGVAFLITGYALLRTSSTKDTASPDRSIAA